MSVSTQRIPNRSISDRMKFVGSWECFDSRGFLIGYVDQVDDLEGKIDLHMQPLPESMGYKDTQLADMLNCISDIRRKLKEPQGDDLTLAVNDAKQAGHEVWTKRLTEESNGNGDRFDGGNPYRSPSVGPALVNGVATYRDIGGES